MKKLILLFSAFAILSCNSPMDKVYTEATLSEDLAAMKKSGKLTEEDATLLARAFVGSVFTGKSLEGKTYKEIIESVKKVEAEQQVLKEEALKKEADQYERLSQAATATVTSKSLVGEQYSRNLVFGFAVKNKSDKRIDAIKLKFNFLNKLGEEIGGDFTASITSPTIEPGATLSEKYYYDFNEFREEDLRLNSEKFEDLTTVMKIEKIVFADGSILE
ncbi:MAG: hypothetical protein WCY77_10195 [Weeksellaceae bacterium]